MTLFKTSFWTGIATFIKAILTYAMWKCIVIYTGASGVVLIEQFQNFLQISRSSVLVSLNQAVVKYVSEFKDNESSKSSILSNALGINLLFCILISLVLIGFSAQISHAVLFSEDYGNIIKLLAICMMLFALHNLGLSVLNGEMEIKKYVVCTVANTFLNFLVTVFLVIHYGLYGGLIGFVLNQSVICAFTLFIVVRCHWFKFRMFFSGIDFSYWRILIKYSLMVFTPTLIVPISLIIVRRYIAHFYSIDETGYWQAIMRLSAGYLIVMNLMLSAYYLPKLSSTKTIADLRAEVIYGYKIIFPLVILGALLAFFLRKPIVLIMYSHEFLPVVGLFKYQLLGDVARMGTWLLCNVLLAKAFVKTFIITEIVSSITYVVITILFIHHYGLVGSAIGFSVNAMLHWVFMIGFAVWYLRKDREVKIQ